MRSRWAMVTALVVLLSSSAYAADQEEPPKDELKTPEAKLSYALGMEIGTALIKLATEIDFALFVRGVEDVLQERDLLLTSREANQVKQDLQKKMQNKRESVGETNRKEGEAFLAENKTKEGVITTASGLQYTVLTEGTGPKPTTDDRVKVNYRGTLLDGTEFDSSYTRGTPATFGVKGVIAGWTEALQLMKVGSKYRLFVPSNLAYGTRGAGGWIGPNAALIFDVELLAIER